MATKNNPGKYDCYGKAEPDEPMFVLLARDPLAPDLVRRWAAQRILSSKTSLTSDQKDKLVEALKCADDMERWREANQK